MTTAPIEAPAKPPRQIRPEWFYIRNVRFCNDKGGNPVLELPLKSRGIHLIHPEDKDALTLLATVGLTCHDGGKFFLNDKPLDFDKYTAMDFQVEVVPGLEGRKITGVKQLKLDGLPAGGMTDGEFLAAWDKAAGIVPPLKTVAADPAMWLPRVNKIVVEFYGQNGFGRDKGQVAADVIVDQIKAAKMSGDLPFAQGALKSRLREEFPEGKPVPPKKFDLEGHQADVALQIADEGKKRFGQRYGSGPVLEKFVLGDAASKFVTNQETYESAQALTVKFFQDYDRETDLVVGMAEIDATVPDFGIDELNAILKIILAQNGATTTLDLVQSPEYDQSMILASYRSAVEAYKTKDVPRFQNGIRDKVEDNDFATMEALRKADIVDPGTPSPDEPAKASEPTPPPAEKTAEPAPRFTADEWSVWLANQKQDYPELKPADIMGILEITRASEWMPRTLKDAAEKLKRAVEVRRTDTLLEDAKRILKDKDVPLEEWATIIQEAGDPKLFTDTSYSKTNYQGKVLTLANAYITAHTAPPKVESAMVPVTEPDKALAVPAAPPSYGVLAALKLPTPNEMQVMSQLADAIVGSALFRGVDTTPRAIAIMLKALQWGIGAIEAFENIYIIPNKKGDQLYPSTNLLRARVMAHPACLRFDVTGDEKKATAIVWRKGDPDPVSFSYSIEDAKTAGLLETYDDGNLKRGTWGTNPKAMLAHRVGRLAVMAKFPDVAIGLLPQSDEE